MALSLEKNVEKTSLHHFKVLLRTMNSYHNCSENPLPKILKILAELFIFDEWFVKSFGSQIVVYLMSTRVDISTKYNILEYMLESSLEKSSFNSQA